MSFCMVLYRPTQLLVVSVGFFCFPLSLFFHYDDDFELGFKDGTYSACGMLSEASSIFSMTPFQISSFLCTLLLRPADSRWTSLGFLAFSCPLSILTLLHYEHSCNLFFFSYPMHLHHHSLPVNDSPLTLSVHARIS